MASHNGCSPVLATQVMDEQGHLGKCSLISLAKAFFLFLKNGQLTNVGAMTTLQSFLQD